MRQLCLILLFLLSNNIVTNGQEVKGKIGFGPFGSGVKMVLGKVDRSTIDQWAGISISYGVSDNVALALNGAYGWVYPRDPNGSQFKSAGGYKTLLYPFNLNAVWYPSYQNSSRPFISLGGGVLVWDIRDMRGTESFLDRGVSISGSTVSPSLSLGLGLEQTLTQSISASLFVKIHYLFKGNEDTIGTGDDNRAVAEAGLGFQLWSNPDRDKDGDGIFDRFDQCPEAIEDYDGFQDLDGCPDRDNDSDGLIDLDDRCPDLPEDIDNYEDEDGCPDLDNDLDGIPDERDSCPNNPEDIDGYEDVDGCPDEDNDQDGIPDIADQCPDSSETMNGFEDVDGCPDTKPEPEIVLEKETPLILRGITFESGSVLLGEKSYATLDSVYRSLEGNTEVEVEIRGYTDSVGEWSYNLRLSQLRADAVRLYLVNRGIESERMLAVGYGESNPIATNGTAAGRARNRRIEFYRIK